MRIKIDVLRSICFSEEDFENIKNLGDEYTDKEIEFMIEFKKIYELGLNQLEKFINKLDEEGKDLETWDIDYYVKHLLNGPLAKYTLELARDKKYFVEIPDILGLMGNNQTTRHNTTLYEDNLIPLEVSVDIYNKNSEDIQNIINKANEQVEKFFRSNLKMAIVHDNTLPIIDKNPQKRYEDEKDGKWNLKSNATFCVKDIFYRKKLEPIRQQIFEKMGQIIGDEHYRIFGDRKTYNPFDSEKNNSIAIAYEVEKIVRDGDNEELVTTDIFGKIYEKEISTLEIENIEKNVVYDLKTVKGQFGL